MLSLLKAYGLNMYYYKYIKKIEIHFKQNNENNLKDNNLNNQIYNNIWNIILIDNSTESYYPFLNLSLTHVNTQMVNRNNLKKIFLFQLIHFIILLVFWNFQLKELSFI